MLNEQFSSIVLRGFVVSVRGLATFVKSTLLKEGRVASAVPYPTPDGYGD